MAIFRCTYCNEIFDLAFLHDLDGLCFCGKCHSEYKEKLKPKKRVHPMDEYNPFEHKEEPPKPKKEKKKAK
jgi:hypothetical protein